MRVDLFERKDFIYYSLDQRRGLVGAQRDNERGSSGRHRGDVPSAGLGRHELVQVRSERLRE